MNAATSGSKFWVQLKNAGIIINGGVLLFAGLNLYRNNDKFYEHIAMPIVRILGAETAHKLSIKLAKYKCVARPRLTDPQTLHTKVWGKSFSNPIGLAAGYDKQGEAVDGMLKMGFGFVEVGSITPEPQPGNPTPRVFRLTEDRAVINRYGFNSDGHQMVYQRLSHRNDAHVDSLEKGVVGVNLGKNKTSPDAVSDYVKGVQQFGNLADYLVINVSSPNTPGLRDLQRREVLTQLLDKVVEARDELTVTPKPPVLVKIAPDLTETDKKNIAAVVTRPQCGIDGIIISNTTVERPETLQSKNKTETGGLSGKPLRDNSLEVIREMYRLTQGKVPIVGVGGVSCGQDAYDKVRAGASLIQLYTALIFQGPPVVAKIKKEMDELLTRDGFSNISEAVGVDNKLNQS